MRKLHVLLMVVMLGALIWGLNAYAQPMEDITFNGAFNDGLKGWKVTKDGPGEFTIKVEKQGNKNVLHIIRKGSHRKKGYVCISQEWNPPAKGDSVYLEIQARINFQQLKTSGRWSKKDPKSACYPIHLLIYSPEKCIYDWGITTRDNPPGYPMNYIVKPDKQWFYFDTVPTPIKGTGVKRVEIKFEGYDFDVEVNAVKTFTAKQF